MYQKALSCTLENGQNGKNVYIYFTSMLINKKENVLNGEMRLKYLFFLIKYMYELKCD